MFSTCSFSEDQSCQQGHFLFSMDSSPFLFIIVWHKLLKPQQRAVQSEICVLLCNTEFIIVVVLFKKHVQNINLLENPVLTSWSGFSCSVSYLCSERSEHNWISKWLGALCGSYGNSCGGFLPGWAAKQLQSISLSLRFSSLSPVP